MLLKILYTKTSVSDIKKLDAIAKKRIKKKIESYAKEPLVYARKLSNLRIGTYRWRIGNYRVVFDLDGNNIIILRIRHRKEIYR